MFDLFKKQFIEVIDWTETENGALSYRFPTTDREIKNGAQLTVRESQMALFVNEGTVADVFVPGHYTLNTKTLPILTDLMNWDKAFHSPFKSEVYFFSTREQIDQKWGTQQPISIRDKEFGVIRLRAFGSFSYKIEDPSIFYQKISGTREYYTIAELDGQLRSMILTSIATKLGKSDTAFLDMAGNQSQFSNQLKLELDPAISQYGLKLCTFQVQSITLPDELQKYLDKQSSVNLVGDMNKYVQFQVAESIPAAAQNSGGTAGIGVGLGAGEVIGQAFAKSLQAMSGHDQSTAPANQAPTGAEHQQPEDPFALLEKLQGLVAKGILTQEEFNAKKAEILKRIG